MEESLVSGETLAYNTSHRTSSQQEPLYPQETFSNQMAKASINGLQREVGLGQWLPARRLWEDSAKAGRLWEGLGGIKTNSVMTFRARSLACLLL